MMDETLVNIINSFSESTPPALSVPKKIWVWDVFGGGLLIANCPFEIPLWRRVLTRVFLGSKWKRA